MTGQDCATNWVLERGLGCFLSFEIPYMFSTVTDPAEYREENIVFSGK